MINIEMLFGQFGQLMHMRGQDAYETPIGLDYLEERSFFLFSGLFLWLLLSVVAAYDT